MTAEIQRLAEYLAARGKAGCGVELPPQLVPVALAALKMRLSRMSAADLDYGVELVDSTGAAGESLAVVNSEALAMAALEEATMRFAGREVRLRCGGVVIPKTGRELSPDD
jgi:hypothetical protein